MKSIVRNKCVVSKKNDLVKLFKLKKFPCFVGCTKQKMIKDQFFDMSFSISKSSGCVQLKNLLPLKLIYSSSHVETVGKIWESHHNEFAEFISKNKILNVLEIGGSSEFLAKKCLKLNKKIKSWKIIDPNPQLNKKSKDKKIYFIKGFFEKEIFYEKYDCIIHSHTFEHSYHPQKFLKKINSLLSENGYQIFSVPVLEYWLKKKFSNAINFEHTFYFDFKLLKFLLSMNNFKIIKKKIFNDRHSYFILSQKKKSYKTVKLKPDYKKNKKMIFDYKKFLLSEINNINDKIKSISSPIFLFGAHIFSQALLSTGLKKDKIICILDNSEKKRGMRLYGSNLKVKSPEILKKYKNPVVILKAGIYNNEIKKQILNQINKKTKFI